MAPPVSPTDKDMSMILAALDLIVHAAAAFGFEYTKAEARKTRTTREIELTQQEWLKESFITLALSLQQDIAGCDWLDDRHKNNAARAITQQLSSTQDRMTAPQFVEKVKKVMPLDPSIAALAGLLTDLKVNNSQSESVAAVCDKFKGALMSGQTIEALIPNVAANIGPLLADRNLLNEDGYVAAVNTSVLKTIRKGVFSTSGATPQEILHNLNTAIATVNFDYIRKRAQAAATAAESTKLAKTQRRRHRSLSPRPLPFGTSITEMRRSPSTPDIIVDDYPSYLALHTLYKSDENSFEFNALLGDRYRQLQQARHKTEKKADNKAVKRQLDAATALISAAKKKSEQLISAFDPTHTFTTTQAFLDSLSPELTSNHDIAPLMATALAKGQTHAEFTANLANNQSLKADVIKAYLQKQGMTISTPNMQVVLAQTFTPSTLADLTGKTSIATTMLLQAMKTDISLKQEVLQQLLEQSTLAYSENAKTRTRQWLMDKPVSSLTEFKKMVSTHLFTIQKYEQAIIQLEKNYNLSVEIDFKNLDQVKQAHTLMIETLPEAYELAKFLGRHDYPNRKITSITELKQLIDTIAKNCLETLGTNGTNATPTTEDNVAFLNQVTPYQKHLFEGIPNPENMHAARHTLLRMQLLMRGDITIDGQDTRAVLRQSAQDLIALNADHWLYNPEAQTPPEGSTTDIYEPKIRKYCRVLRDVTSLQSQRPPRLFRFLFGSYLKQRNALLQQLQNGEDATNTNIAFNKARETFHDNLNNAWWVVYTPLRFFRKRLKEENLSLEQIKANGDTKGIDWLVHEAAGIQKALPLEAQPVAAEASHEEARATIASSTVTVTGKLHANPPQPVLASLKAEPTPTAPRFATGQAAKRQKEEPSLVDSGCQAYYVVNKGRPAKPQPNSFWQKLRGTSRQPQQCRTNFAARESDLRANGVLKREETPPRPSLSGPGSCHPN